MPNIVLGADGVVLGWIAGMAVPNMVFGAGGWMVVWMDVWGALKLSVGLTHVFFGT